VDWWWWAASELPGCLPGRAPGPDPRTRGWMLAYLGRQPSTSPKRKESPSTTRRREKGRRAGPQGSERRTARRRALDCCCSSPPVAVGFPSPSLLAGAVDDDAGRPEPLSELPRARPPSSAGA
jgi:hypothetical protein